MPNAGLPICIRTICTSEAIFTALVLSPVKTKHKIEQSRASLFNEVANQQNNLRHYFKGNFHSSHQCSIASGGYIVNNTMVFDELINVFHNSCKQLLSHYFEKNTRFQVAAICFHLKNKKPIGSLADGSYTAERNYLTNGCKPTELCKIIIKYVTLGVYIVIDYFVDMVTICLYLDIFGKSLNSSALYV